MPKYYFNVRDGEQLAKDEEGSDFTDVPSALAEAEAAVREILAEIIRQGTATNSRTMEVTDEGGVIVAEVVYKTILATAVR